jgi:AcrR family transcriptional regulator
MGRRSDHSRAELKAMILAEGHRHMAQVGYAHFSAREVAKRIGYSIGTIYNVFGTLDALILAINGETLDQWRAYLISQLEGQAEDRLARAVEAYFAFAISHRNIWSAIYEFRLSEGLSPPSDYADKVRAITEVVDAEIAAALPQTRRNEAAGLTRSLLASVHGHCIFTVNGTFQILGEDRPFEAALARVREAVRG